MPNPLRTLASALLLALSAGCKHQYVAIPGATAVLDQEWPEFVETTAPTITVVGDPALTVGGSVTLDVDVTGVSQFATTGLYITGPELYGHWVYPLSADELATGVASVDVYALDEQPTGAWCEEQSDDGTGDPSCAQEADDGVTELDVFPTSEDTIGYPALAPITLPPKADGGSTGTCSDFTYDDCCGGSGGIQAIECYVDPACDCPTPAMANGTNGDGLTICTCSG